MKAKASESESVTEVMNRISHAALLAHYYGISSLPVLINSPLRSEKHPSFYIYSPDGIKVFYKDYATGEKGDIYTLLQLQKGISFSELIREISKEKSFSKSNLQLSQTQPKKFSAHIPSEIGVKIRELEKHDIEYWASYGISVKWLKYAEVYPISHKIIYKNGERYVFHAAKYAYVFVERKEGKVSLKVYQPFSKFKWNTNNDSSVVGLWTKIPDNGDKLVVCSSLKDALCLWANTGIPAIYIQSETIGISKTAQDVLRKRFEHIYICLDNDAPGIKDGISLSEKTGFSNVVLPPFKEGKDISDLFKAKGKEEFIKIVKPLFNI